MQQQNLDQGTGAASVAERGAGSGRPPLVTVMNVPAAAQAWARAVAPGSAPSLRNKISG